MLVAEPAVRALRNRPDPEVVRERQSSVLGRARRRDRVEDQRALAGVEEVVVAGRIPPEDLVGLAALIDVGHELERLDRALVLDRHLVMRVLDERPEAHQERAERHVRVELGRLADAERMGGRLELRRGLADAVPRIRRHADAVPDVVAPDDRVGNVVIREGEVLLRLRVVGGAVRDAADLADLPLDLLHDLVVVDDVVLVLRTRREIEEDVVPALRRHLCLGTRGKQRVVDVVDLDLDVVRLSPLRRPRTIEPRVERGHKVRPGDQREIALEPAPLEPQRSIERLAEARARNADRYRPCARTPEQLASVVPPFAMTRIVGTCHRSSFLPATS